MIGTLNVGPFKLSLACVPLPVQLPIYLTNYVAVPFPTAVKSTDAKPAKEL